jgi:PAS domain S-box-containing protein
MMLAPPSWRFTAGNPAAFKMFGARDEADFISRAPWEYSPPKQPDGRPSDEKARDVIETAMAKGTNFFEWTHQRLDGEAFPATVLLTRMEIGGQTLLQATVRDITERKRAEKERDTLAEQLRMSQKMEAIGRLAGGIAHDFNNLLHVILTYVGLALKTVHESDPLWEDLMEVKKAGKRATTLIKQLLAFGRKQVLQPVVLDLNQIIAGIEKVLGRMLGENIELVQEYAPNLGQTLADPGQIEQVLMNLTVNARDAMPEGGRLTIETANVELDEEYAAHHVGVIPGSYVQLSVTDTGCGMDEQTKARIFEPFFTTKEKGKGTGLGLSTVYGIIKQSGGNIQVNSEPGHGTTFMIYLPRSLSVTTAISINPPKIPRLLMGTEIILLAEDEEAVRNLTRRILCNAGYTVLTAANGGEALLFSAQHAGGIHLLLTDVIMPRMSGKTLAQELSKTRPALRVLYMSGYTDDVINRSGALDEGANFISKPFTSDDLLRKVREVLDT